jgi:hypothetical protein
VVAIGPNSSLTADVGVGRRDALVVGIKRQRADEVTGPLPRPLPRDGRVVVCRRCGQEVREAVHVRLQPVS